MNVLYYYIGKDLIAYNVKTLITKLNTNTTNAATKSQSNKWAL